jgi:hypothetical protein
LSKYGDCNIPRAPRGQAVAFLGGYDGSFHQQVPFSSEAVGVTDPRLLREFT